MNAISRLLLLLLAISPLTGWTAASKDSACVLNVGWEEWYPFIYKENAKFSGSEYEMLTRLAAKAGCQLEFTLEPWDNSLKLLAEGKLDMLYGASRTAERETFAQYSIPYRLEQIVLAVPLGASESALAPGQTAISLAEWLAQKNAAGQPRKLGLITAYFYGEQLEQILRDPARQPQLHQVRWDQKLHNQLSEERIDGYLIEASVVQSQKTETVHWLNIREFRSEPLHLMFSRKVPAAIVERFNLAISGKPLPAE